MTSVPIEPKPSLAESKTPGCKPTVSVATGDGGVEPMPSGREAEDALKATPHRPQNGSDGFPAVPQLAQTTILEVGFVLDRRSSLFTSIVPASLTSHPMSVFSTEAGRTTTTSPADGLSQLKSS
jgi:hypothetical protein